MLSAGFQGTAAGVLRDEYRRLKVCLKLQAVRWRFFGSGKSLAHFIHLGKTGGTAIKHAIAPWSSRVTRTHERACERNADRGDYILVLHPHHVTLRQVRMGEKVFFSIRDPITRFISGFYSRLRQGAPRYHLPWSSSERIAFQYFKTANHLAKSLYSTDQEEKEAGRFAMQNIKHVRDSYWKWFINEEYLRSRFSDIIFICRQERLTDDFEILKRKLGLPEDISLPDDDIQAHRNPGNQSINLDDDAVANLKRWYADDFKFCSMCDEWLRRFQECE